MSETNRMRMPTPKTDGFGTWEQNHKRCTFWIPTELVEALATKSESSGLSKSRIVSEALEDFVYRNGPVKQGETKHTNGLQSKGEDPATDKRVTQITKEFVEIMIDKYRAQKAKEVRDAISDARGHANYRNWSDKQKFVENWLQRTWPEATTDLSNWGDREL